MDCEAQSSYLFYTRAFKSRLSSIRLRKFLHSQSSQSTNLNWTQFCLIKIKVNILDINDNRPIFTQDKYQANVIENSPKGTIIAQVKAIDLDSGLNCKVRYSMQTPEFIINPRSGLITLSTDNLDRELYGDWLNLTIKAEDFNGFRGSSHISINVVDVNDNIPKFAQVNYEFKIIQNLPIGFSCGRFG